MNFSLHLSEGTDEDHERLYSQDSLALGQFLNPGPACTKQVCCPLERMFCLGTAAYTQWAPVSFRTRADKPEEWRVMDVHMHTFLFSCGDIFCAMRMLQAVVAIATLTYNYARPSVST
jgi:hypothetical protein